MFSLSLDSEVLSSFVAVCLTLKHLDVNHISVSTYNAEQPIQIRLEFRIQLLIPSSRSHNKSSKKKQVSLASNFMMGFLDWFSTLKMDETFSAETYI
jgi:hypothetical protein